jgi:hypothetical protein
VWKRSAFDVEAQAFDFCMVHNAINTHLVRLIRNAKKCFCVLNLFIVGVEVFLPVSTHMTTSCVN